MKKLILCMSLCLGIVTQLSEAYAATHTITVTASPSDKGSVRGGGSYEEGTTVYLVAVPVNGYFFQQWSDGNTSNPRSVTVGAADESFTAEFAAPDFTYHFDWSRDVNASNSGTVMTGSYSNQTFYINRVSIWKDYVTTGAVGYPGINIDMCSGATAAAGAGNYQTGYDYGNGKRFAYQGEFSTVQDYCSNNLNISSSDKGRIIGCAHKISVSNIATAFESYTKLYLSASEEYQMSSGSTITFAPQSTSGYPFIMVQGTFGTTSAFITIGTPASYTVTLNNNGATTAGTTSVSVTFGESTNLTTPITKPKKTGYRFMGYTGREGKSFTTYGVIDKDGYFVPGRRGYVLSYVSLISKNMQWIASGDVTLYAVWEEGEEEEDETTYTVTWKSEDGLTTLETDADLASGTATAYNSSTPTKASTAQYNYTFDGWATSANGAKVYNNGSTPAATANATYYAHFSQTTNTYTVAATVSPAGAGTVSGTGTFEYGTNVALSATPANRRYQFSHWTDGGAGAGTDGNPAYTISSLAANHSAVVAVFTEVPVTIADNEESSYYSTTLSTFTGSMDFQLMRTFYAGMWNTVCFPFALSASQIANSDMSGATFYTLTSVTGDAAEGLDFNVSEVTSLSARTPYLVQVSGANITNPVFEGVTLAASAFTNNTSGTNVGDTKFFGTVHPTDLEIGENSGFLFLGQNNALYWPNVANKIRAFRAYFYSGSSVVQSVHPRARIVVRGETPTDLSDKADRSFNTDNSARKYMQDGVLVIERDGKKYNAVGQEIK